MQFASQTEFFANVQRPAGLSLADLATIGGDEPRIADRKLGEVLGFAASVDIRKLIRRNEAELSALGGVFATVAKTSRVGGRPATEYWLTEAQSLLICMFARTPQAAAVRGQIISVFMEWRKRRAPAQRQPAHQNFTRQANRTRFWKLRFAEAVCALADLGVDVERIDVSAALNFHRTISR